MAGNRLRIIRLIPQSSAFYGSDNYGGNTYGQRATDAADLQRYEIVPLGVSASETPLIYVRVGDSIPFRFKIVAYQSEYESAERSGTLLDLSGVTAAHLRLLESSAPRNALYAEGITVPLTIDAVNDVLSATFANRTQLRTNSTWRAVCVLDFVSGRKLTLPPNDSLQIVLTDGVGDSMDMMGV